MALAVLGLLTAGSALAIEDKAVARCAAIENGIRRLACYDGLAKDAGVSGPDSAISKAGAWRVEVETSPIDDSQNVFLSVYSNEEIFNRFGTSEGNATLYVRCKENRTSLYIVWADTFIGSDDTTVEYRIDSLPADRKRMYISTNHTATGLWSGGEAIPFVKKLFGKSQLLARVTPYSESPIMVTFPVDGLEQAIKPLRTACGW